MSLSKIDTANFGMAPHLCRRSFRDHAPLVHNRNALRDGEDHFHVVLGEE